MQASKDLVIKSNTDYESGGVNTVVDLPLSSIRPVQGAHVWSCVWKIQGWCGHGDRGPGGQTPQQIPMDGKSMYGDGLKIELMSVA